MLINFCETKKILFKIGFIPLMTDLFTKICFCNFEINLINYKQHILLLMIKSFCRSTNQYFPIILWSFRYFGGFPVIRVFPVNLGTVKITISGKIMYFLLAIVNNTICR